MAHLTRKQRDYVNAVKHGLRGMTGVSSGICPGCEQCRNEYGQLVRCSCQDSNGGEPDPYCPDCDGRGMRLPTMAEFDEQWSSGKVFSEPSFSWGSCGVCGSSLGGDREIWHWVDKDGAIHHEDDMCVDCVCYIANGDIPERE